MLEPSFLERYAPTCRLNGVLFGGIWAEVCNIWQHSVTSHSKSKSCTGNPQESKGNVMGSLKQRISAHRSWWWVGVCVLSSRVLGAVVDIALFLRNPGHGSLCRSHAGRARFGRALRMPMNQCASPVGSHSYPSTPSTRKDTTKHYGQFWQQCILETAPLHLLGHCPLAFLHSTYIIPPCISPAHTTAPVH